MRSTAKCPQPESHFWTMCTPERFTWAMAIALSRALPLPSQPRGDQAARAGRGMGPALVPLLDFLHHDFGPTTCSVKVRTTLEEVVVQYSIYVLLFRSGFEPESGRKRIMENPCDINVVRSSASEGTPKDAS